MSKNLFECFYAFHYELLFIFSAQDMTIVDLNNCNIIFNNTNSSLNKIICINPKKNDNNTFQKFIYLDGKHLYIYSLLSKNIYKKDSLNSITNSFEDNKLDKIIKVISEISILNFNNINFDPSEIKKKKYLNMEEIKFELKDDKKYNLREKRKISKKKN